MYDWVHDVYLWAAFILTIGTIIAFFRKALNHWLERRINVVVEPMLVNDNKTIAHYAHEASVSAERAEHAAERAEDAASKALDVALQIKRRLFDENDEKLTDHRNAMIH